MLICAIMAINDNVKQLMQYLILTNEIDISSFLILKLSFVELSHNRISLE